MKNGKPAIAIVDYERAMSHLLMKIFQLRDIPVSFVAYDGPDALLKFGSANPKPNIVILNFSFHGIEVINLAREMLVMNPSTKIIFLGSVLDTKKEAYAAGATLFLSKPVSIKTITKAIDLVYNNQGKFKYNGREFEKCDI